MNKSLSLITIVVIFLLFTTFQSCGSTDSNGSSTILKSSFASSKSHNTGQNCMNCHIQGGGERAFSAAGTLYKKNLNSVLTNSVVRLYASPDKDSDPIVVLEVDARGNFYTVEGIDFTGGLYTSAEGPTAEIFMESIITEGSCNSCHGNSTDRIWAE